MGQIKYPMSLLLTAVAIIFFVLLQILLPSQPWINFGYAIICLAALQLSLVVIRMVVKIRVLKLWQHIVFDILRSVFFGWLFYYPYHHFVNSNDKSLSTVLYFSAFISGLTLMLYLQYRHINRNRPTDYLTIDSENKKEKLSVKINELLFIKSVDNYCEVWCLSHDSPKKALIRGSLRSIHQQIKRAHIVRCHRSYIINLNNVTKYSGDSQRMLLSLKKVNEQIPVSKKNVAEIKSKLNNLYLSDQHFNAVNI